MLFWLNNNMLFWLSTSNLFQSHETMRNSDIPEVWIKKKQGILYCYEEMVDKTHFNNIASLVTVVKK